MTVKSADKKPEKYMGSDGKPKIRMVPVDKNVTSEVSKGMVGRYLKKAPASAADGGRDSVMGSGKEKQGVKKVINRITGTRTAVDKMTGKAKVPATEEAEKHVFRFSTKTKQGNIHHSSKDHKSAADAIQKRTGEKVQSMTYKGTVSAMPRRRAVKEDPAFYKAIAKQQAADQAKRDAQDPAAAARRKTAKANIAKRKPVTPDSVGRHSSQGSGFIGRRNENSDAVKAFLAKGGKIKKLPPAKAQGYHGKDDPGKDMHGVMDKPDTKAMGTRKKVKSMEGKTFSDLRDQLYEAVKPNDVLVKKMKDRYDPSQQYATIMFEPRSVLRSLKKIVSPEAKKALAGSYMDGTAVVHRKTSETMARMGLNMKLSGLAKEVEKWTKANAKSKDKGR